MNHLFSKLVQAILIVVVIELLIRYVIGPAVVAVYDTERQEMRETGVVRQASLLPFLGLMAVRLVQIVAPLCILVYGPWVIRKRLDAPEVQA